MNYKKCIVYVSFKNLFGRGALVLVISGVSGAHPFIRDIYFNKEKENLNFFLFKSSSF